MIQQLPHNLYFQGWVLSVFIPSPFSFPSHPKGVTMWNVSFKCKKCGAEGSLFEGVKSFDLNDLKKLPCGCKAEHGEFSSVWI